MASRTQISTADGHPDWSPGRADFALVWERAYDLLRFHMGQGFVIKEAHGPDGPKRRLVEISSHLEPRMAAAAADVVFRVRSLKDSYTLLLRRHEIPDTGAAAVAAVIEPLVGDGYLLGAAGPDLWDCSGLTLHGAAAVGVSLPHRADEQFHMDTQIPTVDRTKIEPWDLLFHHLEGGLVRHVSWYGGRTVTGIEFVWDAEPHSTTTPNGWPSPMTGVGVQKRPMTAGWYTDWAHVVRIGRLKAVNGDP